MGPSTAPPFRTLPRSAQLYMGCTLVAACAGLSLFGALGPQPDADLWLFAVLVTACLACSLFEVLAPGNYSLQPNLVFFFWGALTLPAWSIAALALLCFAPGWVLRRLPWYKLAFNAANYALAATGAHAVASLGEGLSVRYGVGLVGALSVLGAAAVFVAINYALLGAMISLAHRRRLSRSFCSLADGLLLDVGLAMTGACLAVLWTSGPALTILVAGPMVLIYRALYVPLLEHKSRTDAKTGLFNAVHLVQEVEGAIADGRRSAVPVSVVMLDLDHLRLVNNRHGHLAGDQLIGQVAAILNEVAGPHGIPSRFGGEEFCLLLPRTPHATAHELADDIRARVEGLRFEWRDASPPMTISAGVASFPEHGETAEALVKAADDALYDAKAGGRNRVRSALTPTARTALDLPETSRDGPPGFDPVLELPARPSVPSAPDERPTPILEPDSVDDHADLAAAPAAVGRARPAVVPWLVAFLVCATILAAAIAGFGDIRHAPMLFVLLVAAVVGLDLVRIDLFERGNVSPASVPTLVLAYRFGPAGPVAAEAAIALLRAVRREPVIRWSFDFGALGLAGVAAAIVFGAASVDEGAGLVAVAALGGIAYYAVNIPLLSLVMSLSEGKSALAIWRERFAWLWPHYLVFGGLAGGVVLTEHALGLYAMLVFGIPVISLLVAEKQYVERSRSSVTELRLSRDELEQANRRLRALLQSNEELLRRMHRGYLSTITSLARTIEAKDPYTGGHTERVARVACLLASELGMSGRDLEAVEVGGIIHDIGKIGIPDSILLKPGTLTDEEFAEMQRHPELSSYIVAELELPQIVKEMARSHHERYDGTGYPDRLAGEEIPLAARILTVADTLDAMTSDRPYRRALSLTEALDEIEKNSGRQFCSTVVAALVSCVTRDRTLGGQYAAEAPGAASQHQARQPV